MRLWLRLAVAGLVLVLAAMALVDLKTGRGAAVRRLHGLYGEKRRLEKACWELHLEIAELRAPGRLLKRGLAAAPASEEAGGAAAPDAWPPTVHAQGPP